MKRYWDKKYLKKQLRAGKTYLTIAKENNISSTTVQRALNTYELTKPRYDWNQKELALLKRYYCRTSYPNLILPHRTLSSIYHKATRLGLKSSNHFRKYKINTNFFKKWTKSMAYLLGWMFSDGNMADDCRSFRLKLAIKDQGILYVLKRAMNANVPIRVHSQLVPSKKYYAQYANLRVTNIEMYNDLVRLGCTQNKVHKFIPPNIPPVFVSHFIRGYFDGDGSIYFNKPNTIRIRFVGSNRTFILWLATYFNKKLCCPFNFKKTPIAKKLWQCEYYGDNARNLCKWMYRGCENLYLKRKRKRFIDHLKKRMLCSSR
ncbi:MAG: LAGLIDADG family homing endonuclease [Candidatus Micrarchaeota archaeon]